MDQVDLEQRLLALEAKLERVEDRQRIENLYAKHNYLYSTGNGRRIVPELWSKDDAAAIEYGASGVYQGLWKVKTFYVSQQIPGCMTTFTGANRWIHVDADGLHARGVWMVLGSESDAGDLARNKPGINDQRRVLLSSQTEAGEAYRAELLLQKHELLFQKEDGQWRILRLHVSEFFRCPAGSDWISYAKTRQVTDGMWLEAMFDTPDPLPFRENLPNGASTYHWQYDTDAIPALQFDLEENP